MRRVLLLLVLVIASSACSVSSGGSSNDGSPNGGRPNDALIGQMCAIVADISHDAGDEVDTLAETRDRLRDLLSGYGEAAPGDIRRPLRNLVSALTSGNSARVESSLMGLVSACQRHVG